MKKTVLFLLIFTLVLSLSFTMRNHTTYAAISTFSDVSGYYGEESIYGAAGKGWIGGFPDGTFRPDDPLTNAELATLLARVFALPAADNDFIDVTKAHWAYSYIGAVSHYVPNYALGMSRVFQPENNATREYVFTTLMNILRMDDLPKTEANQLLSVYSDQISISTALRQKVARAIKEQFVGGYTDSKGELKLNPKGEITRGQIVILLMKGTMTPSRDLITHVSLTDKNGEVTTNQEYPSSTIETTLNTQTFTIQAKTDPEAKAYINNAEVDINTDGYFSREIIASAERMEIPIKVSRFSADQYVTLIVHVNILPPSIRVDHPSTTDKDRVTISGIVTDVSAKDSLKFLLNGEQVNLNSKGEFQTTVDLQYGINQFTVEAINNATWLSQSGVFFIERTSQGPTITLLTPLPSTTDEDTITVNINTKNATRVYIDSEQVSVSSNGDFRYNWTLQPGNNEITVTAYNAAGVQVREKYTVNYTPTSIPVITLLTSLPQQTEKNEVSLEFVINNASRVTIGKSQYPTDQFTYVWRLNDGVNTLRVVAYDSYGRSEEKNYELTKTVLKPYIEVTPVPSSVEQPKYTLTYRILNADRVYIGSSRVYPDSNGYGKYEWKLSEGMNTITINADNRLGDSTSLSLEINYNVIRPEPSIEVDSVPSSVDQPRYTLVYRVINADSVYIGSSRVYPDSNGYGKYEWNLSEGMNTITITANNGANVSTSLPLEINYNVMRPEPSIEVDSVPSSVDQPRYTLVYRVINADSVYIGSSRVYPDSNGYGKYEWNLSEGMNTITISANNGANVSTSLPLEINYNVIRPEPSIEVDAVPSSIDQPRYTLVYRVINADNVYIGSSQVYPDSNGYGKYEWNLSEGMNTITISANNGANASTLYDIYIYYEVPVGTELELPVDNSSAVEYLGVKSP